MGVQRRGGWVALGERLRRWRALAVDFVVVVAEEGSVSMVVGWVDDSLDAGAAEVVVVDEELVVVLDVLVGEAV